MMSQADGHLGFASAVGTSTENSESGRATAQCSVAAPDLAMAYTQTRSDTQKKSRAEHDYDGGEIMSMIMIMTPM